MGTKICSNCGRELPEEAFKMTRWGKRTHVCTLCAIEKAKKNRDAKRAEKQAELDKKYKQARMLRLEDFKPVELIERLANIGYHGTLTYVEEHTIDITRFKTK